MSSTKNFILDVLTVMILGVLTGIGTSLIVHHFVHNLWLFLLGMAICSFSITRLVQIMLRGV